MASPPVRTKSNEVMFTTTRSLGRSGKGGQAAKGASGADEMRSFEPGSDDCESLMAKIKQQIWLLDLKKSRRLELPRQSKPPKPRLTSVPERLCASSGPLAPVIHRLPTSSRRIGRKKPAAQSFESCSGDLIASAQHPWLRFRAPADALSDVTRGPENDKDVELKEKQRDATDKLHRET